MQTDFMLLPYALYTVSVALVSIIPAYILNERWKKAQPSKLGFFWGYWFLSNVFIGYTALFGAIFVFGYRDFVRRGINGEQFFFFFILPVILGIVAFHSFKRRRWALVISTLLSFNAIWAIVNVSYFRNRWHEFKEEGASRVEPKPAPDQAPIGSDRVEHSPHPASGLSERMPAEQFHRSRLPFHSRLSKPIRLSLFAGLVWSSMVILHASLSGYYGSGWDDDEILEILSTAFWPSLVFVALTVIYEKFVK